MDVFLTILWIVWPYALPFVVGFVLGWLSRWTKIDRLTADLSRARAEVNGDKIHEPKRSPGTGRRRNTLPDVSTAGVSYVAVGGKRVRQPEYIESRYQGGQEAKRDTQPILAIQDQEEE